MTIRQTAATAARWLMLGLLFATAACSGNPPPTATPTPSAGAMPPVARVTPRPPVPPPPPPAPVPQPIALPPEPVREDAIAAAQLGDLDRQTVDELNRNSPLKPVFFGYDSTDLTDETRLVLDGNAEILKQHPTWIVTVEGHSDERGTAEYNLALGERRALSVQTYLVSLGIPKDSVRSVSLGKEYPFEPGHDENAWAKNRRAHFVISLK